MNHNHIYSDSVSCEQLKAVDIIFKEEGRFCPTNILSKNQQQTNKRNIYKYSTTLRYQQEYFVLLGIFGSPALVECLWVSSLLVCQSTLCLHLSQCSELTCCCLIFLCYVKLFIKNNVLLTMYFKENFMYVEFNNCYYYTSVYIFYIKLNADKLTILLKYC
jgi:hypothetical protein